MKSYDLKELSTANSKAASTHNHDGTYIKDGTGTVTSNNIAEGTIVNGDIASNAAIAYSKLSGVAASTHNHDGTYIKDDTGTVTSDNIGEGTIVNYNIAPYAAIDHSKLSGVSALGHTHNKWEILKTHDVENKKIIVRINRKIKLAHVYVSYKTTTNYTNPPNIIPISQNNWVPTITFTHVLGATTHNAALYITKNEDQTYDLNLKLLSNINSGITIVGTLTYPYDSIAGEIEPVDYND